MTDITVVVPAYHHKPKHIGMSERCIALAKDCTGLPFKLIVVETVSSDLIGCSDIYIHEKYRHNPTVSMNRAFSLVDTEFLVLLTNDVFVKEGWLESLVLPFKLYDDCGISTLGSTQFGHRQQDLIEEGNWFSVACWRNGMRFDERYNGVWDDSDLIFRNYLSGNKFYRNFNCVVDHVPGSTMYGTEGHDVRYVEGRELFIEKFKEHANDPFFKQLIGV